ncbi:hypothetical protein GCM10010320_48020 [Streptomyces caelestis]|nr:hypothetical protein GCM10010320_48020 [Streptomyces caelestis]
MTSLIWVIRRWNVTHRTEGCRDPQVMGTSVLSLRIDHELLQRLRQHAARRGMSVQDYVVRTLVRDDFDERFQTAVEKTERFYGVT